jgi:sulfite reductase beta subunit-like hemoprotein
MSKIWCCHMWRSPISSRFTGRLRAEGLATANAGLITDIIACPGLDYCALANARSIPMAQEISNRFGDPQRQAEIGELKIKISGCINACGHHHVGHIGILGVEKKGAELYQISLGGSADENASIGEIVGRGFEPERITMRSKRSSAPISQTVRVRKRHSSNATAGLARALSRLRFMAARLKPPETGV